MPEIGRNKKIWRPYFQGKLQYNQIATMNMYLLNEIKHNVNYMFEIDILRNSSLNCLGVLKGDF